MASSLALIARIFTQYSDKGSKAAQKDINKLNKKFDEMGKRALIATNAAIAGFATLAIKIGKDAVQAAIDDTKSQALLANQLRNTVGATDEVIASVEAYISRQQAAAAVADDELRPSLSKLISITKDVATAQYLQTIALDLSAKAGVDLGTATNALVKAYRGQFKSLESLGIKIDDNIKKNKDVAAALKETELATKGAAAAAAKNDPFKRLSIQIGEIVERLGIALLPVMNKFVIYLESEFLPEIEKWIATNEDRLVKSLEDATKTIQVIMDSALKFDGILKALNLTLVDVIAGFASLVATANLVLLMSSLGYVFRDFQRVSGAAAAATAATAQAGAAATATAATSAVATGWMATSWAKVTSAVGKLVPSFIKNSKAVGLLGTAFTKFFKLGIVSKILILWGAFQLLQKGITSVTDALGITGKQAAATATVVAKSYNQMRMEQIAAAAAAARQAEIDKLLNDLKADAAALDAKKAAITKLEAAKAKKIAQFNKKLLTDEIQAKLTLQAIEKENDRRKKLGKAALSLTDPDKMLAIQMEAIYLNLVKGAKNVEAERLKQEQLLKELQLETTQEYNRLLERQRDILQALIGDNKVTTEEVRVLAKAWNTSEAAAQMYIDQVLLINDNVISDIEVKNLAAMWGISYDQAKKYLDFYQALNDGKLTDDEIKKLQDRWNLTYNDTLKYADFVQAVADKDISDKEIKDLGDRWSMTTDEVIDYILKIGAPVAYSGTILDPSQIKKLEDAWIAALKALNAYRAALGQSPITVPGGVPGGFTPGTGNDPAVIAAAAAAAVAAAAAADEAAALAAEAEAAAAAAAAEAAAATTLGGIRTATTNEELNAAVNLATLLGESASDIANAMMVGLLGQGVDAASAASSARYTGQAIAEMQRQQQEAADALAAANRALNSGEIKARDMALFGDYSTSTRDYDERFRFQSSTLDAASSLSNTTMSSPIINITVQGSVTSENDLIQVVRNGLLSTQYNGNQLLLEAI